MSLLRSDEIQSGGADSLSNGSAAAAAAAPGGRPAAADPVGSEPSAVAAGEPGSSSLLLGEAEAGAPAGGGGDSQRLDAGREPFTTSATTQFCVLLKRTCRSIIRDRVSGEHGDGAFGDGADHLGTGDEAVLVCWAIM